jgi:hypothetical protein
MFCPKCANPASEGQRYCRQCGTNLGAIVDAMEGRRGPVDFERVKSDLKDLGTSMRAGLEQVHQEFKKKQNEHRKRYREEYPNWMSDIAQSASTVANDVTTACFSSSSKAKPKRSRESRRYHLQKGILSIFTGGASAGAYYFILNTAFQSGLLANLEQLILQRNPNLTGLVPVVQMMWVLCLIPVATGIGHLINGMFFAPSEQELQAAEARSDTFPKSVNQTPAFINPPPRTTNEINPDFRTDYSVTEEPTLPLDQPRRERQAS